jgi:hypothetical protein
MYTQQLQAKYYNYHHLAKHFAISKQVLLSSKNICMKRPYKKLNNKFIGPFQILECIGQQTYRLELPLTITQLHPVFHVSLLEPYRACPEFQPLAVKELKEGS